MIVIISATPVTRWPIASHSPAKTNQITLPMNDGAPAVGRFTTVRPNGQSAKPAIRHDASANGIVMMKMHADDAGEQVRQEHPEAAQHEPDDVQHEAHETVLPWPVRRRCWSCVAVRRHRRPAGAQSRRADAVSAPVLASHEPPCTASRARAVHRAPRRWRPGRRPGSAGGALEPAALPLGQPAPDAEPLVVGEGVRRGTRPAPRSRCRSSWPRGSSRPSRGRTPPGRSARTARARAIPVRPPSDRARSAESVGMEAPPGWSRAASSPPVPRRRGGSRAGGPTHRGRGALMSIRTAVRKHELLRNSRRSTGE